MKYQVITPSTGSIDPDVDFFIMHDHIPYMEYKAFQPLNDRRNKYFGNNTLVDLFASQGLDTKDYFFIFDTYLNSDDFESNSYFYPNWLLTAAVDYQNFSPDHKIDFAQKQYSVNCAMNKMRDARLLASCWFSNNKVDGLLHTQSWASSNLTGLAKLDELLQLGNIIDWTHEFGPDVKMLEQRWVDYNGNDPTNYKKNSTNESNFFHSKLNTIFNSTAISIVLEPVFWEHASIACEKYMHAIYGGTIPIVSGYKIYDSLATLGFDTFSDIIDTSSQYERDPILRIWNMLEKNKKLFLQWQELISDKQIQNRILNNLTLLQNPEQIFVNSLKLNSEESLAKIMSLTVSLRKFVYPSLHGFLYLDKLNIPNKTNK
jgi:hypothetical protein